MRTIVALVAAAATCGSASGQSTRSLVPSEFNPAPGTRVSLALASDAGDVAWPASEEMHHFFVRSTGRQSNRDAVQPEGDGVVRWTLERIGANVIGMDLEDREETTTGAALEAFLEGNVAAGAARPELDAEAEITIRRVESFKTVVRVGEGPSAVATDKTGQRAEIRTLIDPTRFKVGSDLTVRAYAGYAGVPGGLVTARNLESGEVVRETVDAESIGNLRLMTPGRWLVAFHHLAAPDEEGGAWTLYSSTLTFDVPAEGGR